MNKKKSFLPAKFQTREEGGGLFIDAYFAVFNQQTEICPGLLEMILPGAFKKSLQENDIRCLFNHDSGVVLGRTGNSTLLLTEDAHGLRGSVSINAEDKAALDVYARVKRGEDFSVFENGIMLSQIIEADTCEVSICTFPAYPQTALQARKADAERAIQGLMERKKQQLKERIDRIVKTVKA